ncbi:MAG: VanZ family protein [Lentisphaeraceae bacterium]|nr:VanZ family protein [Lentisphaeraceae bacterium]
MIKVLQHIKDYWAMLSICLLLSITILSLTPLDNLPLVPGTDKAHHFIAYAALAFPTALRRPKRWLVLITFFIFYSGLIELIQPYVNRYGEWLDMLANTTGVLLGIILAAIMNAFYKREKEKL